MMKKLNGKRIKRAGALALATVMLAGALSLPASAAADQAYVDDLNRVLYGEMSEQALMEKYPNSPEAVFYYAEWNQQELAKTGQLIPYLDQVISLGLATERPYQSKWVIEQGEFPSTSGTAEEVDYTERAATLKAQYEMWTLGHQEQAINAIQQSLDCWDRWIRIQLKYMGQDMAEFRQALINNGYYETQKELDDAVKYQQDFQMDFYNNELNRVIPQSRAELELLRQWYATGASSFDVGKNSSEDGAYVHIEGAKDSTSVSVKEIGEDFKATIAITTDHPIQEIQRDMTSMTLFVPVGTKVTVTENQSHDVRTATRDVENIACTTKYYNNYSFEVYIIGV